MDEQGGRFRQKKVNFSMVPNEIIRDENISLKAKGLYALIQSYITLDNFILYKGFLQSHCREGKKAFESAWKELKDTGYLLQYRMQNAQNQFYYEYELVDSVPKKPVPQKVVYGKGVLPEKGSIQNGHGLSGSQSDVGSTQNVGNIPIPNEIKLYQNNTVSNHIVAIEDVQEQIDYLALPDSNKDTIDEMILLIVEVLNKDDEATMRIARTEMPARVVKERFLMLNQFHIQYALETLRKNSSLVKNIKSYLMTTLYNAPATYNSYYQQMVQHDLERKPYET